MTVRSRALAIAAIVVVGTGAAMAAGAGQISRLQDMWLGDDIEISAGYRQAAAPEQVITFTHMVRIIGAVTDTVSIELQTDHPEWVRAAPQMTGRLARREHRATELVVRIPADASPGETADFTITASLEAGGSDVVARDEVEVLPPVPTLYLPIVARTLRLGPTSLGQIENWNMDGSYVVRWDAVEGAPTYELQEDSSVEASFARPRAVYRGHDTAYVVSGRQAGVYYYRVRTVGSTAWSDPQRVIVLSAPAIYGLVTYKGEPAANIELTLLRMTGDSTSEIAATRTDRYGLFQFSRAPSLQQASDYMVMFGPNTNRSRYLAVWGTVPIGEYEAGFSAYAGSFDIADIALGPHDSASPTKPPVVFTWTRRKHSPSDDYELFVIDARDGETEWRSGRLGYVGRYRMGSRPNALDMDVLYGWEVWTITPNGAGISFDTHRLVFQSPPKLANLYIVNNTGGSLDFWVHGMPKKEMGGGTHLYATFPEGRYTYTASAWCGSLTDTEYFSPGDNYREFYCDYGALAADTTSVQVKEGRDSAENSAERPWTAELTRALYERLLTESRKGE